MSLIRPGKGIVFVAMSGGVDSSTAAALLQEQGYEVVGVTMALWPEDTPLPPGKTGCCSLEAVHDARRVADVLGVPHYVLNFRESFAREVIGDFITEYLAGRTPNPCIVCNRRIKFDLLLDKARAMGADYLATGHYARISYEPQRDRFLLYKGLDPNKDQSYVLYGFTQDQLAHTLLPLGGYRKGEVRRLAAAYGLKVAAKAESQEICFIPDNNYRNFIRNFPGSAGAPALEPGPVFDTTGRLVGRHRGLANYTIGQRRGLGLALGYPAYVVDMDLETRSLIVGDVTEAYGTSLLAVDNNFISFNPEEFCHPLSVAARVRYRSTEAPAVISPWARQPTGEDTTRTGGGTAGTAGRIQPGQPCATAVKVEFQEPQWAVTPGQAVVYYAGDEVLGGGRIERRMN